MLLDVVLRAAVIVPLYGQILCIDQATAQDMYLFLILGLFSGNALVRVFCGKF
jgi:hypothetical protein